MFHMCFLSLHPTIPLIAKFASTFNSPMTSRPDGPTPYFEICEYANTRMPSPLTCLEKFLDLLRYVYSV